MKSLKHSLLLTISLLLTCCTALATPTANNSQLPDMLATVTPTIVNIIVQKQLPKKPFQLSALNLLKKSVALGSGVIINAKKGYIITNAHVIQNEKIMVVTLKDGRRFLAKLIGKDTGFDIAVIQIHADNLHALPIGNSAELKVGDQVAAIGSPFGLTQTVTTGIVSALNRAHPKLEKYQDFIQTDAPINPGNSGGALVNMRGQLIGINTAIYTPIDANIGIGFAIPSNMADNVVKQLIRYGKVRRGLLGVIAENLTVNLAHALGLANDHGSLITEVLPGSAAAKAGLEVQDVIEKIDGQLIDGSVQLRDQMAVTAPGTKIQLTVLRDHHQVKLDAIVGNPKHGLRQPSLPFLHGLHMQLISRLLGNGNLLHGILITDVGTTSPGFLAGLLPGDIITQANGKKISSLSQFEKLALSRPKDLLLRVRRGSKFIYLVILAQQ